MKRILLSFMTIAAVAAVAGVGSFALWSDSETANENYVAAGSLDLLIDGANWDGTAKVAVDDAIPGTTGSLAGVLTNAGTIDGQLVLSVTGVVDDENGLIEPEKEDGDDTIDQGELCGALTVTIDYAGGNVYEGSVGGVNSINLGTLVAGADADYSISYIVDENANNEIMTDRCEFDLSLVLSQLP